MTTWRRSSRTGTAASGWREVVDFRAGGYVQLNFPTTFLQGFGIADKYREDWDKHNFGRFRLTGEGNRVIRAYSMAKLSRGKGVLKFNIRIATPPPGYPTGQMSSPVFSLKPG